MFLIDLLVQRREVLVFSVMTKYKVVKIVCSSSKVVLRIMKHTVIYSGSGPSLKVIAIYSAV
jgi:hypothetical protein